MIIDITSDADLPKCLNTPAKQTKKARQLAQLHSGSGILAKSARRPHPQGCFSRTVIVTLKDGKNVVIQFRPEQLEIESFQVARRVLGPVVPEVRPIQDEELEREGIWVYWLTCIPGSTWFEGARGRWSQTRVTTVRSLGRILSKGYVDVEDSCDANNSSELVIERNLRPHLELILASEDPQIRQFHAVAKDLLGKLDQLKTLPLFIAHFDLNDVNIMVDENCEVSGLIDWELSTPLPFGMGFSRIHTLAGEYNERKFYMPPEFEEAERGFWQEIWAGISEKVRDHVNANLEAVQTAVMLGTLLDAFQLDEGKIGPFNPVVIEALPKFFTYRIPFLRGPDSPPYLE
jgi:hypothetical protein